MTNLVLKTALVILLAMCVKHMGCILPKVSVKEIFYDPASSDVTRSNTH